jgi:hypothetical protein
VTAVPHIIVQAGGIWEDRFNRLLASEGFIQAGESSETMLRYESINDGDDRTLVVMLDSFSRMVQKLIASGEEQQHISLTDTPL